MGKIDNTVNEKNYMNQIIRFQPCCEQEERDKNLILDLCFSREEVLTRNNRICHLTSSGLILNGERDKMLMVHHNIYRTWTWTGGHADGDGNLEAVALREAEEETGAMWFGLLLGKIASLDIIPVYGHIKNGAYVSAHLHLNAAYLLQTSEKEELRIREGENSGVAWVPLSEVADHSKEPELIRIYQKMLSRIGISLPVL